MSADSWEWLKWYGHYKNCILPAAGGLLDQTAVFVEAMEAIEGQLGVKRKE